MDISDKVKRKLAELPDKPGCYVMRDRRGRIIYVGKALSLRKRVQSYFRDATLRSASPKLRGLVHSVDDLETILTRTEAEALLMESRLIKDYRPRYNVSLRDDKRFLLLRVDLRHPFPRFELCRIQRDDGATYFGPYVPAAAARTTLDFVEKRFGIRKCPPLVPGPSDYEHCINDIVRFCSAPCVGKIGAEEYRGRVELACGFLRGEHPEYLKEIKATMDAAAKALDFERAAALRDMWMLVAAAMRQRRQLSGMPEMRAGEARLGVAALREILQLPREPRVIEAFDVSTISGSHSVASLVCSVEGLPQRQRYRRFRIKTVEGVDDPAMMSEVVRRRFERLQSERQALPDLVLVDGGPTQVRAARTVLDGLGLGSVCVAGLAKRYEEIHSDRGGRPIRLEAGSPALKVLQQLRDEAHRFAIDYHRRLRSKRIEESALDEIPGVGLSRKQHLLEHFQSVRRIREAAEADIAAVPGIGVDTAHLIKAWLCGTQAADRGG